MLFSTPSLDSRDLEVIERTRSLMASVRGLVSMPPTWMGSLRRVAYAKAIRGSNSIEGYSLTIDDALAVVDGQETMEASEDTRAATKGYRDAMTYVLRLAQDRTFAYSTALLKSLHFMMLKHDLSKHPGAWRNSPIFVRDEAKNVIVYRGPDEGEVDNLMNELVETTTREDKDLDVMVRAAMGHLNLVMIHPFSDGNGRMARCFESLILTQSDTSYPFCSIEEYLGRNTRDYYDVLHQVGRGEWSPNRDARPWIRFSLTAHFQQATTTRRRITEMARLWEALETNLHGLGMPERFLLALSDAAMGYRVRNAGYRLASGVSSMTAGEDLKKMVEHQFLVAMGLNRGRYYVASDELIALRGSLREPKEVEDPYGGAPLTIDDYSEFGPTSVMGS